MTKRKIVFAEGCFDNFDGTQEELDELVSQIQEAFENTEFETHDGMPMEGEIILEDLCPDDDDDDDLDEGDFFEVQTRH